MPYFDFYENESDDEDIFEENIIEQNEYNCEEESLTRFNIVLCEFYNEIIHGNYELTLAKKHYLVAGRFKILNINYINNIMDISSNMKLEIAECFDLETLERIAIIKTIWIKLIQRKWKNILKKRKEIIIKRCNPKNLRYKEIYGNWPKDCLHFPTLKGMLHSIL